MIELLARAIDNTGAGPLVWSKKIVSFQFSPYPLTAFLDGDTCFCGTMGLNRLFGVLGTGLRPFDLAYILEKDNAGPATYRGKIPADFRERNTGVVVYRANRHVAELFAYWEELFHIAVKQDIGQINDQPSLRDALWRGEQGGGRGKVRVRACGKKA